MATDRRTKISALLSEGKTGREIAQLLGISPATVSYHKARLDLPMNSRCARRHDWAAIQAYYDAGHSLRECQETFGFSRKTWYDAAKRGAIVPRPQAMPLEELLSPNTERSRFNIKLRLISAGLKESRCEECGLSEWRGKPLSMALHHINGDGLDNRLENLVLLCPNCHSQTPNFSAKNSQRGRLRLRSTVATAAA